VSQPHTCPKCEGRKCLGTAGDECPTCEGTGVVWEPEQPSEVRLGPVAEGDPYDLTYRP
jgi:DnaJ-class molecular chaperone